MSRNSNNNNIKSKHNKFQVQNLKKYIKCIKFLII